MYDDTAFDMHGEIPVTQHDVNDYPWAALGYSIVSGVKGLEVARRDRMSDINTVLAIKNDPPLGQMFRPAFLGRRWTSSTCSMPRVYA